LKPIDKKLVALIDTEENEKKKSKDMQFSFDFVFSKVFDLSMQEATTKRLYD